MIELDDLSSTRRATHSVVAYGGLERECHGESRITDTFTDVTIARSSQAQRGCW